LVESQAIDKIVTGDFKNFLEEIPQEDQILTYIFLVDVDNHTFEAFRKLVETQQIYSLPRNFVCLCTRCREIRNKEKIIQDWFRRLLEDIAIKSNLLVIRKYLSSVGEEYFVSFEDAM
jgi:hypothetical protein